MKPDTHSQWPDRWQGPLTKLSIEELSMFPLPDQLWADQVHLNAIAQHGILSTEIVVTIDKINESCHVYFGVWCYDDAASKVLLYTEGGPTSIAPLEEIRMSLVYMLASHRRNDPIFCKIAPVLRELKDRLPVLQKFSRGAP